MDLFRYGVRFGTQGQTLPVILTWVARSMFLRCAMHLWSQLPAIVQGGLRDRIFMTGLSYMESQ